jgi:hypothetical protein
MQQGASSETDPPTGIQRILDLPLARVQLIVGLDYPRWLSLLRLLRRTVARGIDRRPICNGNVESFRLAFSRDWIVYWHFRSFKRKRRRMHGWAADPSAPAVVLLRSPRQTQHWLDTLNPGLRQRPDSEPRAIITVSMK